MKKLRLGTRDSQLAMAQAKLVKQAIEQDLKRSVELVAIKSQADKDLSKPLHGFGNTGVFTRELEKAMLDGRIDLAVHSAKDLSSRDSEGLCISCFLFESSPYDALVSANNKTLGQLPPGAKVGCGSPRRVAQLKLLRPELQYLPIRGNLQTRLGKLKNQFDAIILAEAGLKRLDLQKEISHVFSVKEMIPAHGQGVLALQCRKEDERIFSSMVERATQKRASMERQLAKELEVGCSQAVALHIAETEKQYTLHYFFAHEEDHSHFRKGSIPIEKKSDVLSEQVIHHLKNEYHAVQ